jgi:hypothetical protein
MNIASMQRKKERKKERRKDIIDQIILQIPCGCMKQKNHPCPPLSLYKYVCM